MDELSFFSMHDLVTPLTKGYEVLLLIAARMAAERLVMDLQPLHAAAHLATPTVALQYLAMQFAVAIRIEFDTRLFGTDSLHEARAVTADKNVSCCGFGRKR